MTKAYQCPVDQSTLVMSDRQGVEIDYCPTCRGVWLDRGELDKIIERSQSPEAPAADPQQGYSRGQPATDYRQYGHGKRKKSFIEELFD